MVTPVAALLSHQVEITGHGSLTTRPIDMVEAPLRDFGAAISTNNGYLPINVKGALSGGSTSIDGSLSSQLLTGLLMALPLAENDSEIRVSNLKSKPYIDITVDLLKSFGIEIENESHEIFRIRGRQKYTPCSYNVEGDWSGASCPLVAGAIAGSVTVTNLDCNSAQADKEILTALQRAGAKISITKCHCGLDPQSHNIDSVLSSITVSKSSLQAFTFDATHCPDLFPALVALASQCSGTSQLLGAKRLTHKESNRALTLQQEFGKLGIKIELRDDEMLVTGGAVNGGEVASHNDHRIAMALATAALCASSEVSIDQAESVDKSYPEFWEDLEKLTN
jgi:3-phosphoshikimate 1-carboxyvinyltransferase